MLIIYVIVKTVQIIYAVSQVLLKERPEPIHIIPTGEQQVKTITHLPIISHGPQPLIVKYLIKCHITLFAKI